MRPKKITRMKEATTRLGCGRWKFEKDYVFQSDDDPFVPGTLIERLKPIHLGPRNLGFVDGEIDELIDALANTRGRGVAHLGGKLPKSDFWRGGA